MTTTESAFESRALALLEAVQGAAEEAGLEAELAGGILTIEGEDGRQWVLNRHAPTRQLWLASPISGAAHFTEAGGGAWTDTRGGAGLIDKLRAELGQAAGARVDIAP